MSKLIFDIETIGEDFDEMSEETKDSLTGWIDRKYADEEDIEKHKNQVRDRLALSPLTGEIVAIGVLDYEKDKGAVYYQSPEEEMSDISHGGFKFRAMPEAEMLEHFWEGASDYDEFISFNGRAFDVPYIMIRSAIHEMRPSKNLMSNRYLGSQKEGAKHVDLLDQLSFYGAVRNKKNLHMWARAFGIESPKAEVSGKDVADLFEEGKFLDIAEYNVKDLEATRELYRYWDKYLRF